MESCEKTMGKVKKMEGKKIKVEYRPEFENVLSFKDMGLQASRWYKGVTKELAIHAESKDYPGYTLLESPKYKQWIKKTVILRTKDYGERFFWLDKDNKVVACCTEGLPVLIGNYIRDYAIPRAKNKESEKELRDGCPGPCPMIGEVVLMRTYPLTIKEKREEIGLSRAEISRKLEIPIRTLEDWESGKRTPPAWAEKLIIEKLDSIAKENPPE